MHTHSKDSYTYTIYTVDDQIVLAVDEIFLKYKAWKLQELYNNKDVTIHSKRTECIVIGMTWKICKLIRNFIQYLKFK